MFRMFRIFQHAMVHHGPFDQRKCKIRRAAGSTGALPGLPPVSRESFSVCEKEIGLVSRNGEYAGVQKKKVNLVDSNRLVDYIIMMNRWENKIMRENYLQQIQEQMPPKVSCSSPPSNWMADVSGRVGSSTGVAYGRS